MTIDRNEWDEQADNLLEQIAKHSGSFELEEVAAFPNGMSYPTNENYKYLENLIHYLVNAV